jgi:hypothetical protein
MVDNFRKKATFRAIRSDKIFDIDNVPHAFKFIGNIGTNPVLVLFKSE